MNWKPDVIVDRKEGYCLRRGKKIKIVPEEDAIIVELIENGVTDESELTRCVMDKIEHDETLALFRLAQFVEDYADYLREAEPSRIIEV